MNIHTGYIYRGIYTVYYILYIVPVYTVVYQARYILMVPVPNLNLVNCRYVRSTST